MKLGLPISLSFAIWSVIGIARYIFDERLGHNRPAHLNTKQKQILARQVAICIAAHNEAAALPKTLSSLTQLVPPRQIYIVSDGSTDSTASLARQTGCHVLELHPGRGKAAALEALLAKWKIFGRYQFVLIADADTTFPANFLDRAMSRFVADPKLAVITAKPLNKVPPLTHPSGRAYFILYRLRLWQALEWFFIYGQTWRLTNVNPVIPGYASLYRAPVLRQLKIHVPGLAIEDYNLGFQLRLKKLGTTGFFPSITASSHDPDNFSDYWNQVQRWNIGFWQTIKHWKVWPSFFWLFLGLFTLEVISATLLFLIIPTAITFAILIAIPGGLDWNHLLSQRIVAILGGTFAIIYFVDYAITVAVALYHRRPSLMLYGLSFILIHYVNSIILLLSIPTAFLTSSSGRWNSPKRWLESTGDTATQSDPRSRGAKRPS